MMNDIPAKNARPGEPAVPKSPRLAGLSNLRGLALGLIAALGLCVVMLGVLAPQSVPAFAQSLRDLAPVFTLWRLGAEALVLWQMPRLLAYVGIAADAATVQRCRWRIGSFMAFYELLMAGVWLARSASHT